MSGAVLAAAAAGAVAALLVEHVVRALLDPGPMGVDDWGQPHHTQQPVRPEQGDDPRPHGCVTTRRLKAVP